MHELGITRSIVSIVDEHSKGGRVKRVVVAIGELSGVVPESVEFCFEICAKGTSCEDAELVIERIAGRGKCQLCGHEQHADGLLMRCEKCDEYALDVVAGQELLVREMEV